MHCKILWFESWGDMYKYMYILVGDSLDSAAYYCFPYVDCWLSSQWYFLHLSKTGPFSNRKSIFKWIKAGWLLDKSVTLRGAPNGKLIGRPFLEWWRNCVHLSFCICRLVVVKKIVTKITNLGKGIRSIVLYPPKCSHDLPPLAGLYTQKPFQYPEAYSRAVRSI